jgi:uncharacterized protein
MSSQRLLSKQRVQVSLDFRWVSLVLAVVLVGMLLIWKPWSGRSTSDRTIEVRGESIITAKPDEFVFYPSYEFKNSDTSVALADLSKKSNDIVAKLKELGVQDKHIKTSSSGYDYPVYKEPDSDEATYTLQLTVTITDLTMAQKVQDYLVSTGPMGSVSPQATFSDKKRKQLESQARDLAAKDARVKADQMAKNIGFKVGKVKSINEDQGFSIMPVEARGLAALDAKSTAPPLTVQPGENELPYSVTVTYYIR